MDLFTPTVSEDKLHHNFKNLIKPNDPFPRQVITDWASGFTDRDGKFVKEFQTTFNSSFWELYIHAVVKQFGYSSDFSKVSPDFVIDALSNQILIEATTANHAQESRPEWETDIEIIKSTERDCVVKDSAIRLANALINKVRKYNASYKALNHVKEKPFILAIAPFNSPMFWVQNDQAIRQVLYGYDKPIYQDFPHENRREIYGHKYLDFIEKPNGAEVPMGYFRNEEMNEVSAVIFSNTATFGKLRALSNDPGPVYFEHLRYNEHGLKPRHEMSEKADYNESLLDGLHVYHNPMATYPLGEMEFDHEDVTHHNYLIEEGFPISNMKDGALIQRSVIKFPKPNAQADQPK